VKLTLVERFWSKVKIQSGQKCWLWQGCTSNGYGQIRPGGYQPCQYAHRVAWELAYGPIPDGLDVLHKCDTPRCVRPSHLFLGTPLDNAIDRDIKGRHGQKKITHCPMGHPLSGSNVYIPPKHPNSRGCRKCRKEQARRGEENRRQKLAKEIP
jgi:hypothetical protein